MCPYVCVCGVGNDGVLKQSPTPTGPSLSVPSIIVELLMIPIHTPAQRRPGELGGGRGACESRKREDGYRGRGGEREPERKIVVWESNRGSWD